MDFPRRKKHNCIPDSGNLIFRCSDHEVISSNQDTDHRIKSDTDYESISISHKKKKRKHVSDENSMDLVSESRELESQSIIVPKKKKKKSKSHSGSVETLIVKEDSELREFVNSEDCSNNSNDPAKSTSSGYLTDELDSSYGINVDEIGANIQNFEVKKRKLKKHKNNNATETDTVGEMMGHLNKNQPEEIILDENLRNEPQSNCILTKKIKKKRKHLSLTEDSNSELSLFQTKPLKEGIIVVTPVTKKKQKKKSALNEYENDHESKYDKSISKNKKRRKVEDLSISSIFNDYDQYIETELRKDPQRDKCKETSEKFTTATSWDNTGNCDDLVKLPTPLKSKGLTAVEEHITSNEDDTDTISVEWKSTKKNRIKQKNKTEQIEIDLIGHVVPESESEPLPKKKTKKRKHMSQSLTEDILLSYSKPEIDQSSRAESVDRESISTTWENTGDCDELSTSLKHVGETVVKDHTTSNEDDADTNSEKLKAKKKNRIKQKNKTEEINIDLIGDEVPESESEPLPKKKTKKGKHKSQSLTEDILLSYFKPEIEQSSRAESVDRESISTTWENTGDCDELSTSLKPVGETVVKDHTTSNKDDADTNSEKLKAKKKNRTKHKNKIEEINIDLIGDEVPESECEPLSRKKNKKKKHMSQSHTEDILLSYSKPEIDQSSNAESIDRESISTTWENTGDCDELSTSLKPVGETVVKDNITSNEDDADTNSDKLKAKKNRIKQKNKTEEINIDLIGDEVPECEPLSKKKNKKKKHMSHSHTEDIMLSYSKPEIDQSSRAESVGEESISTTRKQKKNILEFLNNFCQLQSDKSHKKKKNRLEDISVSSILNDGEQCINTALATKVHCLRSESMEEILEDSPINNLHSTTENHDYLVTPMKQKNSALKEWETDHVSKYDKPISKNKKRRQVGDLSISSILNDYEQCIETELRKDPQIDKFKETSGKFTTATSWENTGICDELSTSLKSVGETVVNDHTTSNENDEDTKSEKLKAKIENRIKQENKTEQINVDLNGDEVPESESDLLLKKKTKKRKHISLSLTEPEIDQSSKAESVDESISTTPREPKKNILEYLNNYCQLGSDKSYKKKKLEDMSVSSIMNDDEQFIDTSVAPKMHCLESESLENILEDKKINNFHSTSEKIYNATTIPQKYNRYYAIYNSDCDDDYNELAGIEKYMRETILKDYRTSSDEYGAEEENRKSKKRKDIRKSSKTISPIKTNGCNSFEYRNQIISPKKQMKEGILNGLETLNEDSSEDGRSTPEKKQISPHKSRDESLDIKKKEFLKEGSISIENNHIEDDLTIANDRGLGRTSSSVNTNYTSDSNYSDELTKPVEEISNGKRKTILDYFKHSRDGICEDINFNPEEIQKSSPKNYKGQRNSEEETSIDKSADTRKTVNTKSKSCHHPDELEMETVKNLTIFLPFSIPPLHQNIRYRTPVGPSAEGIRIKYGAFSKSEDDIIMNNWKRFCEEHGLNVKPSAFFKFRGFRKEEKIKFLQYISHGIDDRLPDKVHNRFKKIYENMTIKKGRFSEAEDKEILRFMDKYSDSDYPFLNLGKILNRNSTAVLKRYETLKNADNNHKIVWDLELSEKLVRRMMKVGKCDRVEDLENLQLNTEQWHKLSRKMGNIPLRKLQRGWKITVYPRLFSKHSILGVKRKIFYLLQERKENDWRTVNWAEIAENFAGYTSEKVYNLFRTLVNFHVPKKKQTDLRECLKILKETRIRKMRKFRRFIYKEGKLKYESSSEED